MHYDDGLVLLINRGERKWSIANHPKLEGR